MHKSKTAEPIYLKLEREKEKERGGRRGEEGRKKRRGEERRERLNTKSSTYGEGEKRNP